ncbi:MAG: hypothetical protein SO096_07905 [Prevotella sp.]|nr:hypothetical protein [Prevotella sp.]
MKPQEASPSALDCAPFYKYHGSNHQRFSNAPFGYARSLVVALLHYNKV